MTLRIYYRSFFEYLVVKNTVGDMAEGFEVGLRAELEAKSPFNLSLLLLIREGA